MFVSRSNQAIVVQAQGLESVYSIKDPSKSSFFKQKKLLEAEICTTVTNSPLNKNREAINSLFNCTDQLKINEVKSV
jgi:hypothetical protein